MTSPVPVTAPSAVSLSARSSQLHTAITVNVSLGRAQNIQVRDPWRSSFSSLPFIFKLIYLFFLSFSFFLHFSILGMNFCHAVIQRTGGRAKAVGGDRGQLIPFQVGGHSPSWSPNPELREDCRPINPRTGSRRACRGPGELPVAHADHTGSHPSSGSLVVTCFSLLAFLPGSPASPLA